MDKNKPRGKSAEEKPGLSRERFHIFLKHTPSAVAMFDKDMRYIAVSNQWLEDYGITGEDVIGRSHYEIFPDISGDWVEIYQICLTGITKKGEDTIITRDGTGEWVKWEIQPWYESTGDVGGIIIYTDLITDRKNTEMELIKAREEVEEASKAKSTFIANMSHEFRTPLNAILGYSQIMQNSGELSEEQRNFVDEISSGGKQLLSMINNVIDLSKIETSTIEYTEDAFATEQLLKEATDDYLPAFEKKGLRLTASISEGVPKTLSTDLHKLDRILQQLLSNSLKFTDKGEVKISIGFERVEHSAAGANGKLSVLVSDSGIGIAEEKMELIFKPFSKVHPDSYEGTGLGLTLVQRLTRFLGGSVEVKSVPEEGSDFKIIIPVKASRESFVQEKTFSFTEQQNTGNGEPAPADVSKFIKSLTKEDQNFIKEAIELQDLEKLSNLGKYLNTDTASDYDVLNRLQKAGRELDYLFFREVHKNLE